MLLFLLFIPDMPSYQQAHTIIEEIAANPEYKKYEEKFNGDLPVFMPHITIMGLEGSNIEGAKIAILGSLKNQKMIQLNVDAIRATDYYFRSVVVLYQKNSEVSELILKLRASLKSVPELSINSSNENYLHMSLVYTAASLEHKQLIAHAPLKSQGGKTLDEIYPHGAAIKLNKVILISTEEDESPAGVRNWTVQAEYPLD